jgi:hypothetical protein
VKPPKYEPLRNYLAQAAAHDRSSVNLEFSQVSDLVGGLPPTAYERHQWWANDSKVQAQARRAAGWHVDTVAFDRRRVRFLPGQVGGAYSVREVSGRDRHGRCVDVAGVSESVRNVLADGRGSVRAGGTVCRDVQEQ